MKKIFSNSCKLLMLILVFTFLLSAPIVAVHASPLDSIKSEKIKDNFKTANGDTLPKAVGGVITAVLGLVGLIFIILIIWAGFKWLFAQGDEAKIKKARDMILQSVIAVIIIFSAYVITSFVFKNALGFKSTGSGGQSETPVSDALQWNNEHPDNPRDVPWGSIYGQPR